MFMSISNLILRVSSGHTAEFQLNSLLEVLDKKIEGENTTKRRSGRTKFSFMNVMNGHIYTGKCVYFIFLFYFIFFFIRC